MHHTGPHTHRHAQDNRHDSTHYKAKPHACTHTCSHTPAHTYVGTCPSDMIQTQDMSTHIYVHLPPHSVHMCNYSCNKLLGLLCDRHCPRCWTYHMEQSRLNRCPHDAFIYHLTCMGSYRCTHSEEAHRAGAGCPAQDTEPSTPLPASLASLPLLLGHGTSLAQPEPVLVEVLNITVTERGWPGVGVGVSGAELLEMGL